ncbi:hypothetical protein K9U39_06705 [Rhodoblastus acidophilus]|uniref:Uncharacterized protein n=1 Tax=Candidatus Rhodoblastus alkanivorans TaxID=2954117 RepID=A0ABS9Z6S3_9HYPH|nr:hypothetical protein [Candidatus Rhodoblastus alkanivorans]MCI4680226.1 hypothetical protein [Candidatus Rhodoblastus alkanivorans]MCI4683329.1 hypothetical protein [Candidatus Rhodoblastus alkanivorans]MDI4640642.1 hypothetical protein [Rhodoblastus acidophilus]
MTDVGKPGPAEERGWASAFLFNNWPFLVMLLLALIGVAMESVTPHLMSPYWEVVVPIFAIASYFARGEHEDGRVRFRAIRQDAVHWVAVFLAMRLLMSPQIFQLVDTLATQLMLLTVLALGVFTSGNLIGSWRIGLVGILLGAAVPAVAWMQRSTLLLTLTVTGVASVAILIWLHLSGNRASSR